MILFRSSAGENYIELHRDGGVYWFKEQYNPTIQARSGRQYDPYGIIGATIQNRWLEWPERPWLTPMLEFMVDYFGEDLFTLVALENL